MAKSPMRVKKGGARTKDTYVAAQYRRLLVRRGPNRAAVAVAHTMIVAAWHMLTTGETYRELGADYFTRREDPDRRARAFTRQLEQLGYTVELTPAA
jgi:hypothetical protein